MAELEPSIASLRARAREALCLVATLLNAPAPEGSLPQLLASSFELPEPALPEAHAFAALLEELRDAEPLLGLAPRHAERALAWAPAILGGLAWVLDPQLSSAARLALRGAVLERLGRAPAQWPPQLARLAPLAVGPIAQWPASLACRQAQARQERAELSLSASQGPFRAPARL